MKKGLIRAAIVLLFVTSSANAEKGFFGLFPSDSLLKLAVPHLTGGLEMKLRADLWVLGTKGTMGLGRRTAPLDVGFSNIPENLGLGLMGSVEVGTGRYFVVSDVTYAKISPSVDTTMLDVGLSLEIFSTGIAAGYNWAHPWGSIGFFAGARFTSMNTKLDLDLSRVIASRIGSKVSQLPTTIRAHVLKLYPEILANTSLSELLSRNIEVSPAWVDPFTGGRLVLELGHGVRFTFRGEVGGLVAVMWHVIAGLDYKLTSNLSAGLVYRHLSYDYEKEGVLIFHAAMTGPAIAFQMKF
jgi:hypothetical protein